MRKVTLTASVLAIAAGVSVSGAGIELTTNGGFEAGDTSGWTSFPTPNSTFNLTNDAASGNFAAEVFNNDPASGAVVKQANLGVGVVNAGDIVNISFAAKGEGAIGGVAFAEFFSEIDGGGVSSSTLLGGAPLNLTSEYQTFNFSVAAGFDVSGGVTLQFAAVTGANQGSVIVLFIDDVSVSVIPAPAGMAVLGLGGLAAARRRR
jgi:MYXO-CTERM domain-containing protein